MREQSFYSVVLVGAEPEKMTRLWKIYRSLRKGKFRVSVLHPKSKLRLKGFTGRILSGFLRYLTLFFQVLFVQADVIHFFNVPDFPGVSILLRKRFVNTKFIYDVRSPWSDEVYYFTRMRVLWFLARLIERVLIRGADIVITVNEPLAKRTKKWGARRVEVVPNYPDENFKPRATRQKMREENGVSEECKVVLFVGKLSRIEGVPILLHAIQMVLSKRSNVVFWIVGDGPLRRSVEFLIGKHPAHVKFFGWQPHNKIPDFIVASDLCVVPRYKTLFSHLFNDQGILKVNEYAALGKPIVASGILPSNQYILVEPDRFHLGILKALNGEIVIPKRRTWSSCAKKLLSIYKELMGV